MESSSSNSKAEPRSVYELLRSLTIPRKSASFSSLLLSTSPSVRAPLTGDDDDAEVESNDSDSDSESEEEEGTAIGVRPFNGGDSLKPFVRPIAKLNWDSDSDGDGSPVTVSVSVAPRVGVFKFEEEGFDLVGNEKSLMAEIDDLGSSREEGGFEEEPGSDILLKEEEEAFDSDSTRSENEEEEAFHGDFGNSNAKIEEEEEHGDSTEKIPEAKNEEPEEFKNSALNKENFDSAPTENDSAEKSSNVTSLVLSEDCEESALETLKCSEIDSGFEITETADQCVTKDPSFAVSNILKRESSDLSDPDDSDSSGTIPEATNAEREATEELKNSAKSSNETSLGLLKVEEELGPEAQKCSEIDSGFEIKPPSFAVSNIAKHESSYLSDRDKSEEEKEIDFSSLKILILGKSGVGKSSTINLIMGENKAVVSAFEPSTSSVEEIVGISNGSEIRALDTPGLRSDPRSNRKILNSVRRSLKRFCPDIVLYLDRSDTWDDDDRPIVTSITSSLGPSIWEKAVIVLSHSSSSSEISVEMKSRAIERCVGESLGNRNWNLGARVCLVENHFTVNEDLNGRSELLNLCYSMKNELAGEVSCVPRNHQSVFSKFGPRLSTIVGLAMVLQFAISSLVKK